MTGNFYNKEIKNKQHIQVVLYLEEIISAIDEQQNTFHYTGFKIESKRHTKGQQKY